MDKLHQSNYPDCQYSSCLSAPSLDWSSLGSHQCSLVCLFFSVSLSNIFFVPSSASFHRLPLGSLSRLIISRLTSMFSILCLFFSTVIEISSSCPRLHHFIGSLSRIFIQFFFFSSLICRPVYYIDDIFYLVYDIFYLVFYIFFDKFVFS